ncbi:lipoprotein [Cryobacterium sp. SO2]|uniref:lipoprotein n=1 Tax=Cryobacterium sp. SO2 TaxID=1897060 RepID=UPI00223E7BAC|nr:lipoprotein [Cryobacterium sp. SO2]WEO78846.1 lipoprotein [Cryobacterium sp. SO2]
MKKPIVLAVMVVFLAGCTATDGSESTSSPSSPTSSASATPTSGQTASPPTAAQITWAGEVCSDTSTLKTDVQGLATAAATGGDSVGTAVSDQMTTISASASALVDTVKSPPDNLGDDPELKSVQDAIGNIDSSLKTLEASASQVEGTTGAALVDALATVVGDTGTVLSDVAAAVQTIGTAMTDTSSTLGQAFRAAPECAALTA